MPQVINTNIPSLNAQRNLNMSQTALATSLQRLSSGLRINSAKDDAAGLAISERMTTQIRGTNQAIRNASDGISLAQTGEGALAELTQSLQRIRELAVQAANATNSTSDRAALNLEVQQRLSEIDRVASQTSFNGRKILDGTFGNATFQVGPEAGQIISLNLESSARQGNIGQIVDVTSGTLGAMATGGSYAVAANTFAFGTPPNVATAGSLTLSPASRNFGTAAVPFTGGSNTPTVARTDYSQPGTPLTSGSVSFNSTDFNFQALVPGKSSPLTVTSFDNDGTSAAVPGWIQQGPITDTTFAGAGLAQFDVKIGAATLGVTLNADYGGATAVTDLATALQTQIQSAGGVFAAVTVTNNAGTLTFTNVGSATAIDIANVDVNGAAAGFAALSGQAGAAINLQAAFDVDGFTVTMTTDSVNIAGFAADLTTKLQTHGTLPDAANYSAAVVSGRVVITHAGTTNQVDITNANAKALASGITNVTGVAGTAASAPSNLVIDGLNVTLNQNYGSFSTMAAGISIQLGAGYTVTADANGDLTTGDFKISRTTTGAGSLAIDITGDAASDTAGITTGGVQNGTDGTDLVAQTQANFQVGNATLGYTNVALTTNLTDRATVLATLQSQLAGYNVTDTGTAYQITSLTSSDAIEIINADTGATSAGFANSAGTAGTAAISTTNASFTIDGFSVTLDQNYLTFDALATALDSKLEAGSGVDPANSYSVTNNNGTLTISRATTGSASTAIDITAVAAGQEGINATATGFGVQNGTDGVDASDGTNATFTVDGHQIALTADYLNYDDLAANGVNGIEDQLNALAGAGAYTVTNAAGTLTILNTTDGSTAASVTVAGDIPGSNASYSFDFDNAVKTDGVGTGSVTLASGDLTIQVGDNTAVNIVGEYPSANDLAVAINRDVSGVFAEIVDGNKLRLMSPLPVKLSGTQAGTSGTLGFQVLDNTPISGSLIATNVTQVTDANETIVRMDSALTAVSNLRSTFGAIQNRFESTISNLSTTAENLTASRSRIQDADFAAETAALTRAQILQQAGVAMLAQANALPQQVLRLLQ